MKKLLLLPLLLSFTLTAHAKDDEYTVTVRKLLKSEANTDAASSACIGQQGTEPADEKDVPASVRGAFRKAADKDARGIYTWKMGAHTLYMVDATSEGNGCCYFFTKKGSKLGSFCGTESSEWGFEK